MAHSDRKDRTRLEFLEWEARTRPRRHVARLFGLVVLGYAYPVLLLAGSFGLLVAVLAVAPFVVESLSGGAVIIYLLLLFAALLLLIAILGAFRARLAEPDGQLLRGTEAPALRALIAEVQRATSSPPVHAIYLDMNLNAGVIQRRRFAFWGVRKNYLIIGVPLLLALTPEQLRVVLAHEFGHLRGRHGNFRAWIYRIHHTWATLEHPFRNSGKLRTLVIGWFVDWYGRHFSIATLPLRRLHEYDADARSAALSGPGSIAGTLIAIAWFSYRMDRAFWPNLLREAAQDALPPADILARISRFLAAAPPAEMMHRWRRKEQLTRTPIHSEHPCLADRLKSLQCRDLLDSAGDGLAAPETPASIVEEHSAIVLLGDQRQRITAIANASWKAMAIARWRMEHAAAKEARESAANPDTSTPGDHPAEPGWRELHVRAQHVPPDEQLQLIRDFVTSYPGHGGASFHLGQMLLGQDDENAIAFLEASLRSDSRYIGPALHLMLDYYREAGRDDEADPIRRRLEEHQRAWEKARTERLKVSRKDRFLAHELGEKDLEKIRKLLYRYPQVQSAWLVKKQVRLFTDKPSYVLAVKRRTRLLEDRKSEKLLTTGLMSQIELSCAVVILARLRRNVRSRLRSACPSPVFVAPD